MSAHNTSSTSLYVAWEPVPEGHVHGILRGYWILYRKNNARNFTRRKTTQKQVDQTGLHKFTVYDIRVVAFTIKGSGVESKPIFVSTDEDGEFRSKAISQDLRCVSIYIAFNDIYITQIR